MNYDREILQILSEAGRKGLSIAKIARHVFNRHNNLFEVVAYEDVRRSVAGYLMKNSKQKNSYVEKTEERGVYRLSLSVGDPLQLLFDFKEEEKEEKPETSCEDKSLSLF